MSLALIVPTLAAAFSPFTAFSPDGAAPRALTVANAPATDPVAPAKYVVETSVPHLHVEGQSYVVTLKISVTGKTSAKLPSWFLTPAAWLVDKKPLMRRAKSVDIVLTPGQTLETKLDLGPLLTGRMKGAGRDFRIQFSESLEKPEGVIWLSLPEKGIDFQTLPKEQLTGYQVMLLTSGGPIWVELWPEVAPNHVRNFLDLAASGAYDGSQFHRVIPGFMVQGGKASDGSAAPRKLDAEFSSRRHAAGVLSAARNGADINSATSEFFIVHKPSPHLDGSYSAFGQVIVGMDSVDTIVKAVEIHYELIGALKKKGVPIDERSAAVATAMNTPKPEQMIHQALVVRASKSRPKRSK